MKTEELVALLAAGDSGVPAAAPRRRYARAIGLGAAVAAVLMAGLLGLRPDLAAAVRLPMFWGKIAFLACLAAGSFAAALRLSMPGAKLAWVPAALAAPVLALWALALAVLVPAAPAERAALFFGETWNSCPLLIAMLSLPVFCGVLWAMQGLAPTRLRLAGASAGLLAGSVGALVYSLHCPELAAPFLAFWYLLGILVPTALGAALGPRLLAW